MRARPDDVFVGRIAGVGTIAHDVAPTTGEPAAAQPGTGQPTTEESGTAQPAAAQPTTDESGTAQHGAERAAAARPAAEQAAAQPAAARPTTPQHTAEAGAPAAAAAAGARPAGPRIVVGMWQESPLGRFADVMIETEAGHRILLAPRGDVAEYVAGTYMFDEVRVTPVAWRKIDGGIRVTAGADGDELDLRLGIGAVTPLGMLLRAVPRRLATRPAWLTAIDPVARLLLPGAATAGSAGGGRREFYGVTLARRITSATGRFGAQELTGLAPLSPPVRFGFGSAPATPALVDVTTTIRHGAAA